MAGRRSRQWATSTILEFARQLMRTCRPHRLTIVTATTSFARSLQSFSLRMDLPSVWEIAKSFLTFRTQRGSPRMNVACSCVIKLPLKQSLYRIDNGPRSWVP